MKRLFTVCFILWPALVFAQGLDSAFRFNSSGIIVQKVRMAIIAENVANLTTLKVEETGLPYQKKYAMVISTKDGAKIDKVERSPIPFGKYWDPTVPQSDENGFFYYPNVNMPDEMINMTYTEAVLEANFATFKTTKSLYQSAIDTFK